MQVFRHADALITYEMRESGIKTDDFMSVKVAIFNNI